MRKNYDTAVIFGGVSSENEVSVITGTMVCNVLLKGGKSVLPVYIDHGGKLYADEKLADVSIYKNGGYENFATCGFVSGGAVILSRKGKMKCAVSIGCVINCCHGGTGSGKSTLINLIPHFYDASEGEITVDGVNVNAVGDEVLRAECGIVPQRAVLFKGTIRENIKWGNESATDEEIFAAAEAACAADVIKNKPDGLDEIVEQGGKNFSGGQRQRLTIARALVKKPKILILDDSASALDYATDANLRKNLRALDYNPTVFIVSQRTSSVRFADKILVLDGGELVGCGTHDELLKNCGVYKEIHMSQYAGGDGGEAAV